LRLYYFPSSPHCLKVRAAAYELDVHLGLTAVNVFRRETDEVCPSLAMISCTPRRHTDQEAQRRSQSTYSPDIKEMDQ
jgi:hypothetical protein